jgi:hypothetical protein
MLAQVLPVIFTPLNSLDILLSSRAWARQVIHVIPPE